MQRVVTYANCKGVFGGAARAACGECQAIRRALHEGEAVLLQIREHVVISFLTRPKSCRNLPLRKEMSECRRACVINVAQIALEASLIGVLQREGKCERC